MADQIVQVATDGAGKKIDVSELTVGANTVERQRVNISDPTTAAAHAAVANADTAGTEYGLAIRPVGTGMVVQLPKVLSANFTRPANTTAYLTGELVANSTTAGSVTPLSWTVGRLSPGRAWVTGAKIKKSAVSLTNAYWRLHLFTTSPTVTNGDNGTFTKAEQGYLGSIDVISTVAFTDAAVGFGGSNYGPIPVDLASGQTLYGLIETKGAYTPASSEVFTVDITVVQ